MDEVCDVGEDYYGNILIALTETVNNAITHSNKLNPAKKVELTMKTTNKAIVFVVKNQGSRFDFNAVTNPTITENLEKLRGRGIFLMKVLFDELSFEENERVVKLKSIISDS